MFAAEGFPDKIKLLQVVSVAYIIDACYGSAVCRIWLNRTVIYSKLFKVGNDAHRQLGAPSITAHLVSRIDVALYIYAWLLGFHKKQPLAIANAKGIVRRLGGLADLKAVFMNHFTVAFSITVFIIHVPTKA